MPAPVELVPMVKLTVEDIDRFRTMPSETEHLEFKEAKNTYDTDKLKNYCVALANEGGGFLVLGVADVPPRPVVGTKAFPKPAEINNLLLQACGFRVDIQEIAHPDGRILVFVIPGRPAGVAYHLDGRYLMRAGASLVGMSADRLRQIFAEGSPHWVAEPCSDALSAQQVISILDTESFFGLLNSAHPTSAEAIIDRLHRHRLLVISGAKYRILRLGALLLARKLEDFPDISRHASRVVVYTGTDKLNTRLDQIGGRGYASGFSGLVKFVTEHMPRKEVVENALRREKTLVPEIVIRELVANALVHQDLTPKGTSPMIEIYSDRIEISNPGEPIVSTDRFIDGYRSRNEQMAEMMRLFGICEEKGSGIDRVISAAEESHLSAPDIRSGSDRTDVIVFGPRQFSEMSPDERIRATYQHCALKYVVRDHMTNQTLRLRFQLPDGKTSAASQVISATIDAGLVKPDTRVGDSKKYARYLPYWA